MSTSPTRNRLVLAAALAGGLVLAAPAAQAAPFAPTPLAAAPADVVQAQYGYGYGPRHLGYGPPRHRHFGRHGGWDGPRYGHHHHGYGHGRGHGRGW